MDYSTLFTPYLHTTLFDFPYATSFRPWSGSPRTSCQSAEYSAISEASNCPNEVVNVSFLNFCVIHQEILALVLLLYFVVIIF